MNKALLLLLFTASVCFSQEGSTTTKEAKQDLNCYNKWAAKFEDRGADDVKDGIYTDVIVTVRYKGSATCYTGKAEVIERKITKFYILLEDGTYEEVRKSWKGNSAKEVTITGGMSSTIVSIQNELVNILFPSKLKPKKPKPKMAPEPTDD